METVPDDLYMKPLHCNQPGKPYVELFGRHSYMTGLRCMVCKALFLPDAHLKSISDYWRATEPEREQLRLEGIAFDNSLTP